MDRKATLEEVILVTNTGGLAWTCATPIAGLLADSFSRLRLIRWALGLRVLLHVLVPFVLLFNGLSAAALATFAALSGVGSAVFDAAAPPAALSLVPETEQARALSYSLGLPRAAWYLTGVVCLLVVAIAGLPWLFGLGALGLTFALILTRLIPIDERKPGAHVLLMFFDGLKKFFTNPGLVALGALIFIAHFAVHPLYWVSPASRERIAPENLEVALCAGVILCAIFMGKLSTRMSQTVLLGVGVAILGLGISTLPIIPPWTASGLIGIALMIVVGNAGARFLLDTPDAERGRILSTSNLLYELGGDAGVALVVPYAVSHGPNTTLYAMGLPLIVLGAVLAFTRGLPAIRS
jgi:MFS family permease